MDGGWSASEYRMAKSATGRRNRKATAEVVGYPGAAGQLADAGHDDLPLTVSRPDLLSGANDREFRQFVHRLLAFSARLETIRSGFGALIGLSGIQYSALIAIAHLSRDQDIGVKEVADHLALSGSFATLVIGQLVTLDLVGKQPNPDDRRRVRLTVTEKGRNLLSQLAPTQRQVNDLLFEPLDGMAFRQLNALFGNLVGSGDSAVGLVSYLTAAGMEGEEAGPLRRNGRPS